MRASICVLVAVAVAASTGPALAALAKARPTVHAKARHAAAGGQTWTSGRCRLAIPKSWGDRQGGKADPKDHGFNATLGRAGDPGSLAATVRAMRGRVLVDAPDMVLMSVDLRGRGARQYWAVTRPGPGCRATVTFSEPSQDAEAKKIAQSLRKAS